ncbi:hypothetical protein [Deinococcus sp. ME38]|uniref:hypothetical protein n=1 Tax=Deinococcus sp. ME38 TaxID=3400344 RepID=UPI003B5B92C0
MQIVSLTTTNSVPEASVFNATVRGVKSGANYSFTVEKPSTLLGGSALDGALKGDVLQIQVPLDSGGFGSFTLRRTTIEKFNTDVAKLKTLVAQQQAMVISEKNRTAALKTINTYFPQIKQLAATINADLNRLNANAAAIRMRAGKVSGNAKAIADLAAAGKCAEMERMKDDDTIARGDIASSLNAVGDYVATVRDELKEYNAKYGAYKQARDLFIKEKGNVSALPSDAGLSFDTLGARTSGTLLEVTELISQTNKDNDRDVDAIFEVNCP